MRKTIIGLIAGLIIGGSGIAYAANDGTSREVDTSIPCQKQNQLNCTWYGEYIAPGNSENPPNPGLTYWINFAQPDGQTFCRFQLVPIRALICATHWPLTAADGPISTRHHKHN